MRTEMAIPTGKFCACHDKRCQFLGESDGWCCRYEDTPDGPASHPKKFDECLREAPKGADLVIH